MKQKLYAKRIPYGRLHTQGQTYQLLSPHPLPKDSWLNDNDKMFSCAKLVDRDVISPADREWAVYGYDAITVVTNNYSLYLGDDEDEIYVWLGEWYEGEVPSEEELHTDADLHESDFVQLVDWQVF